MRTLLFDLSASQPNASGDFHGGGKYSKIIFLAIIGKIDFSSWTLICCYDSLKKLDPDIKDIVEIHNLLLIDINNSTIRDIVEKNSINRVYSALPSDKFVSLPPTCEFFSTIHGLRFIELSASSESLKYTSGIKDFSKEFVKVLLDKFKQKKYYKYYSNLISNSTVITVSNHTKFSIKSFFPDSTIDLPVFYSPDVSAISDIKSNEHVDFHYTNYFLLVSGNRWIKNNLRSVIALDQLFTDFPEIQNIVVVTGVSDPQIYLRKIVNKHKFTFLNYVEETLLKKLYKNAFAFLYMSLNEGFGYPPLEAMSVGIPVITSPFTSIPEICGDAVLYANPLSIDEIKNRILNLLMDKLLYEKLANKGFQRYLKIKDRQDKDLFALVNIITG